MKKKLKDISVEEYIKICDSHLCKDCPLRPCSEDFDREIEIPEKIDNE